MKQVGSVIPDALLEEELIVLFSCCVVIVMKNLDGGVVADEEIIEASIIAGVDICTLRALAGFKHGK